MARANTTVGKLSRRLDNEPILNEMPAAAIHMWNSPDIESVKSAIRYMGKFIARKFYKDEFADSMNQYRPACISSAVAWRLCLAGVLRECNARDELVDMDQSWTKWIKVLKLELPGIMQNYFNEDRAWGEFGCRAPSGKADMPVSDLFGGLSPLTKSEIRITTFHKVKGETLDAVLVVSASNKKSNGGHWEHWLDIDRENGEHSRFAYVASSRPKRLLAWAVPDNSSATKRRLAELGFSPADETGCVKS